MSRNPTCTVGYSSDAHFPKGAVWYIDFLPKGFAPTEHDRLVCAFPDNGQWDGCGLKEGERPPLVQAVIDAIETYMSANPDGWHHLSPTSLNKSYAKYPKALEGKK